MYSLLQPGGKPSPGVLKRAATLGQIVEFAWRHVAPHRAAPMDGLMRMVDGALDNSCVQLFHSRYGNCIAYVIWAWLSPAVERRMLGSPSAMLEYDDWTEGTSLWILDFSVEPGALMHVLRSMAQQQLFRDAPTITYIRRKNVSRIVKQLCGADLDRFRRKCPAGAQLYQP